MKNQMIKTRWLLCALILLASQMAGAADKAQDDSPVSAGEAVFRANCLSCHQANGSGVPMLAPPLQKTTYVLGSKSRLIGIVLNGFNEDAEIEGEYYSNPMPAFPQLSDQEIADVLTYIRSHFQNSASAVTAVEVKAERARQTEEK